MKHDKKYHKTVKQLKFHLVLQVSDAVLTYAGVSTTGTHMEGNPFIKSMMEQIGILPAILLVKLFALGVVVWFFFNIHEFDSKWLNYGLKFSNAFYLLMAVIPWVLFLSFPHLFHK